MKNKKRFIQSVLFLIISIFIGSCSNTSLNNTSKIDNKPIINKRDYVTRCVVENWITHSSHNGILPPNMSQVIGIPNKIIYRSGQIDEKFIPGLKALGIKTIITLSSTSDKTKTAIKEARIIHREFDYSAKSMNIPKINKAIDSILDLPGPILVHCRAGADRTGIVIASLRARLGEKNHKKLSQEMTDNCHVRFPKYEYYQRIIDWYIQLY